MKIYFREEQVKLDSIVSSKVWRDMPYDAVLDYENVLYRVEVKGVLAIHLM